MCTKCRNRNAYKRQTSGQQLAPKLSIFDVFETEPHIFTLAIALYLKINLNLEHVYIFCAACDGPIRAVQIDYIQNKQKNL